MSLSAPSLVEKRIVELKIEGKDIRRHRHITPKQAKFYCIMCKMLCFPQCRLCLCNKKSMIDIFTQKVDNGNLVIEVIEDLLNLKVWKADGLPQTICIDCCSKVIGYKKFKVMCMKSREILWRKSMENFTEHRALICDYVMQSIEFNKKAGLNQDEVKTFDDDSLSSVSTLIWPNESEKELDFDEESIHLKLESSSDISECSGPQEEVHNDLEFPNVKETSVDNSCDYSISECSVVLTRFDMEKYKASQLISKSSDETSGVGEEAGHKSHNGPSFPCTSCKISFSSMVLLSKHKKSAHGNVIPEKVKVDELYKEIPNKTSPCSKEESNEILNEINGPNKEKSYPLKQVANRRKSPRGKCAEWLNLKNGLAYTTEKVTSSKRKNSLKKVASLRPSSNSNIASLEKRTVKRMSKRERFKADENSSMGSVELNSIISSTEQENKSKRCKRKFMCNVCKNIFVKKSYLKVHKCIHKGIKLFSCQICSRSFRTKYIKIRHEATHYAEKPFSCPTCAKCFRLSASLKKHLQIHSMLKLHKCRICEKAFHRPANLRKHERVHTGERPFKCKFCPKAFALKGNLLVHFRAHTGERPFECKDCGKQFSTNTILKRHQKNIHNRIVSKK